MRISCAVRGLVERIELEPAPGVRYGLGVLAAGDQPIHQAPQHRNQLALESARLGDLPVVEVRAVTQREPLEKATRQEDHRLVQPLDRRVPGDELAKALDIELETRPSQQGNAVAAGLDPLVADRLSQRRQRAPERPARVLGVVTRP